MSDGGKSRQTLLAVLGVAILIVAVVGISYAGFNLTANGGDNSITSGTITMTYQEPSNNVVISNAMPTSDGYGSTTHFDFSVSATAKAAVVFSYEISVTEKEGNSLSASSIRIGLKKGGTVVDGFASGKLASTLTASTVRSGSKTLYTGTLTLAQSGSNYTATDSFQLFLWLDSGATVDNDGTTKYYSILVNVNATAPALAS